MASVSAGQQRQFSMTAKQISLKALFNEIKKQTNLVVFYNNDLLDDEEKVDVAFTRAPLKDVMQTVLRGKALSFRFTDSYIILARSVADSTRTPPVSNGTLSQQDSIVTLSGKVVEGEAENPLAGVTIQFADGTGTTISDEEGRFRITGKKGTRMTFQYVGYAPLELRLGVDNLSPVRLTPRMETLEDVVVTGYQVIDKRTFTGSVGKVDPEGLATAGISDVGKALQGMVAGVAVENTSGTFGTKSKIRIRGNSSISGNQEPLWVVDGVVLDDPVNVNPNQLYSGDAATMLSSAISGINPDDIEDIQVLKDASATAMYGTQAVNGVIVVTTKKGRAGQTNVSYKNNFSMALKPSITSFNVMNSKQRMEFSEELYEKNIMDFTNLNSTYGAFGKLLHQLSRKEITWEQYYDEIQRAKTYNTDWFDVLFRNSINQEHSVSLSTGTEKAQYYMSGSYFRDDGQTRNQYVDRFSGNLKGNFNLSDKFSITGTLYGSVRNQRSFGAFDEHVSGGLPQRDYDINPYTYARTTSRAMRPYNDSGELEFYQAHFAPFNILHEMDNNFVDIKLKEIRFQLDGLWKITSNLNYSFILSARGTSAMSEHISTELSNVAQSYRAMQSVAIRSANDRLYDDPYDDSEYRISVLPRGGIAMVDNNQGEFYTVRNMLNYKPVFNNVHILDLMAGTEIKQRKYNNYHFTAYGLEYYRGLTASPDYRAIQRDQLSATGSPYYNLGLNTYREASFFANLAYSYDNKYNVTLSTRADGSNRLGASERFRFLPIWVAGVSWNVDNEAFLQDVQWLDFLKVRGSYGTRGNISGLGSPELLAYYGTTTRFNPNEVENIISIEAPDNPTMQWEKEKMANAAIEFGLFSRVSATLEWYHRDNYDLIGAIQVSRASGFTQRTMNWADMRNEGFEVTLSMQQIKRHNFQWSTIFTYGYNKNEVTRLQTSNGVIRQTHDRGAPMLGRPVAGLYSFRFATLDENGLPLFYTADSRLSNSFSRYTTNLDMLKYEGSREPLGSGGLTNQFQYKNISLSFLFTFSYGNKIRLNPLLNRYFSDVDALDAALANRWTTPGDERYTNVPRIIEEETRAQLLQANAEPFMAYNRSDIRVADGSFIRFKNVMIAYDIPHVLADRLRVKNLKITAQAQNLALWADPSLNGQDPEAIVSGIFIPAATSYTLGLNLNF
ncbi:SusC/RagA family TonB-linked outer membrane protein [Parapedobacter composti]|nr:SusC/RagA family TonB-linked outer membrane protein [Parapedobacter composti]